MKKLFLIIFIAVFTVMAVGVTVSPINCVYAQKRNDKKDDKKKDPPGGPVVTPKDKKGDKDKDKDNKGDKKGKKRGGGFDEESDD
jgi:hypothetical protein